MPNVWTHLIFGQSILKKSGVTFSGNEKVFNLGTQGPDPFFYYHFWPWKKDKKPVVDIGSLIHKQHCGKFLIEMIEHLKNNEKPELKAYVFGFVSHHILDRNAHPYIVYRSGEEGNKHQKLEIYIDTLLMKEIHGMDIWRVPAYKEIEIGRKIPDSIITMMVKLLREVHQNRLLNLEHLVNKSYQDMISALKVLFDPSGMKNKILGEMISPFSYTKNVPSTDFLNLERKEWLHPTDEMEISTESFYEIFDRAEKEGILILQAIEEYLKGIILIDQLKILIGNLSYETGKSCDEELQIQYFEPIL